MKRHRIISLDVMRAVAVLSVVVYHYFYVYELRQGDADNNLYSKLNDFINLGVYGVVVFFFISGFVIRMSVKGETKSEKAGRFVISRFFRVYPPYVIAVLTVFLILNLLNRANFTWYEVLINLFMVQDFYNVASIDGVFWTLLIEIKFYAIACVLYALGGVKDSKLVVVVFSFLGCVFDSTTLVYMSVMFAGALIFEAGMKSFLDRIVLVFVVAAYFLVSKPVGYGESFGYSFAFLCSAVTFLVLWDKNIVGSRVLSVVGGASYSLYLFHQEIGYILIDFQQVYLNLEVVKFLVASEMILFSVCVYEVVEKRTVMYGRKFSVKCGFK